MAGPRFIADPPDEMRKVELDGLTALYHRPSGLTHILAAPAPQILDALAGQAGDAAEIAARIAADGSLVPAGTAGAYPPLARPLKGEVVKAMLYGGRTPAGVNAEAAQAYANYIRRLQAGMSGFTCYASLQMPR